MMDGIVALALAASLGTPVRATVETGILEGARDTGTGVRSFRGVPFAAPPVGPLRWREPAPPLPWTGVRPATEFGPRPVQPPIFGDMVWRSPRMDEDCLYLNVWAPERGRRHPVLVYFYGGGFVAGDGSEPRYDGAAMARRGIVAITVNYRLGAFGFLSHPEFARESGREASGNYGLMDQSAALRWVRRNVAAFGGDPRRVTIAGESAGSFSVSAQMASRLARGTFAGAIGESGAFWGETLAQKSRADAERNGIAFGVQLKAPTLAELRRLPAEAILAATDKDPFRFGPTIDGYALTEPVPRTFSAGRQTKVPLLAGWNAEEAGAEDVLGDSAATPGNFAAAVRRLYGEKAPAILRAYPATDDTEAARSARDLAGDRFIGYGTWAWTATHARTGGKPVFRYLYDHARPGERGAYHAAEIEYALGNLDLAPRFAWTDTDRRVSEAMASAFARFVRTGSPNGAGLPRWPAIGRNGEGARMVFAARSGSRPDGTGPRYRALDAAGR